MQILVTGGLGTIGLGTIGAGLITELRKRGHHIVSCDLHHQSVEIGFVVLKVTGADPKRVHHQETEILTTKLKRVDTSKLRLTAEWMRSVYKVAVRR